MTTFQSILLADAIGFAVSFVIAIVVYLVRGRRGRHMMQIPTFCEHCSRCYARIRVVANKGEPMCVLRGFCGRCSPVLHTPALYRGEA